MNVRKHVDYSAMYMALDSLMAEELPQMKLYCEIGRLVNGRSEKGAVVAAAEYLRGTYPDVSGFSPRNLRRMRECYRTYEAVPKMMAEAMTIGWTQNVVIFEADLTFQEREWYIQTGERIGWAKLELQRKIKEYACSEVILDLAPKVCYTKNNHTETERKSNDKDTFCLDVLTGCQGLLEKLNKK